MNDLSVLDIHLYGAPIGTLTRFGGDRVLFAFTEAYMADPARPTLSLAFKTAFGELITDFPPTQTRIHPFLSNLLPEGPMRDFLAVRAGVNPAREFFLLRALGHDLPGAVTAIPADGECLGEEADGHSASAGQGDDAQEAALRFSLAGVQLKFSAMNGAGKGLTIPAGGSGGQWIVKLPSREFPGVPENEFSMMTLARLIGIDVPRIRLVDLDDIAGLPERMAPLKGKAFTIERFDRKDGRAVHMEDFAQVFGVYPEAKYEKAGYRNIAKVVAMEAEADIPEFIRRLTFAALIGNADMHLKNWSMIYADPRRPSLAPAYDLLSTIPYIPDTQAALKFSRTKRFDQFTEDELAHLAAKAMLPERLVIDTARETVDRFLQVWTEEKTHLPLFDDVRTAIDGHLATFPLSRGRR